MHSVFALALASTGEINIEDTSNAVINFAEIINKYGELAVILAVFLICFVGLLVIMIRNNRKFLNQLVESNNSNQSNNQELVNKIVEACIDQLDMRNRTSTKEVIEEVNKKEEDSHKSVVSVYINANLAFKDASRIAMSNIKCQRVAIYLFHNGNSTPYGYPFAKMSCVHEWTMKGTSTVRGHDQVDVPLYAFVNIVEELAENGELAIGNIYDYSVVNNDEHILQFISGSNTHSIFMLAIKNADGCLAAFTVAEFKDAQDFSTGDSYNKIKSTLKTMNENIYSIVISNEFKNSFTNSVNNTGDSM